MTFGNAHQASLPFEEAAQSVVGVRRPGVCLPLDIQVSLRMGSAALVAAQGREVPVPGEVAQEEQ